MELRTVRAEEEKTLGGYDFFTWWQKIIPAFIDELLYIIIKGWTNLMMYLT